MTTTWTSPKIMKIFGEHFMSKSGDKVGALNAKRSPSTMDDHNNEATIDDLTQQKNTDEHIYDGFDSKPATSPPVEMDHITLMKDSSFTNGG